MRRPELAQMMERLTFELESARNEPAGYLPAPEPTGVQGHTFIEEERDRPSTGL